MADMFYDEDADLSLIQGRKVAVIGYGTGGGLAFTIASADPRVRLALAYDSVGTDIDLVENIKGAAVSFYAADNVAAAQSLPDLRAAGVVDRVGADRVATDRIPAVDPEPGRSADPGATRDALEPGT